MTTFAEYRCTGAKDSRSISSAIKLRNISVVLYLIIRLHYQARTALSRSRCQPSTMSHKWSRCTSNCRPGGTPSPPGDSRGALIGRAARPIQPTSLDGLTTCPKLNRPSLAARGRAARGRVLSRLRWLSLRYGPRRRQAPSAMGRMRCYYQSHESSAKSDLLQLPAAGQPDELHKMAQQVR